VDLAAVTASTVPPNVTVGIVAQFAEAAVAQNELPAMLIAVGVPDAEYVVVIDEIDGIACAAIGAIAIARAILIGETIAITHCPKVVAAISLKIAHVS
jgi:hypothetical protein